MCVEHHDDANEIIREVAKFRRERCDESREVPLFVGAEAAGPVNPLQVPLIELRPLPLVSWDTIIDAGNLVDSLLEAELFEEARSLLREYIPVAQRTLGDRNYLPFDLRSAYARAISRDTSSSLSDVHEGVAILEDVVCTTQRVFGTTHPNFIEFRQDLEGARMRLADDESRAADA